MDVLKAKKLKSIGGQSQKTNLDGLKDRLLSPIIVHLETNDRLVLVKVVHFHLIGLFTLNLELWISRISTQ